MGILDDFLKNNNSKTEQVETQMDQATKERTERIQAEMKVLTARYDGDHSKALSMWSKLNAARKGKAGSLSEDARASVELSTLIDRYNGDEKRARRMLSKLQGGTPSEQDVRVLSATATRAAAATTEAAAEQRYAALSDREQRAITAMRTPGGSHIRSLSKTFDLYDAARERVLNGRNGRQFGAE